MYPDTLRLHSNLFGRMRMLPAGAALHASSSSCPSFTRAVPCLRRASAVLQYGEREETEVEAEAGEGEGWLTTSTAPQQPVTTTNGAGRGWGVGMGGRGHLRRQTHTFCSVRSTRFALRASLLSSGRLACFAANVMQCATRCGGATALRALAHHARPAAPAATWGRSFSWC